MKNFTLLYNPYLPELKVSADGEKVSIYSSIMSYHHKRIHDWAGSIMHDLYSEANGDYSLNVISTPFVRNWICTMAERDPHCISCEKSDFLLSQSSYQRLHNILSIYPESMNTNCVVPIINYSENPYTVSDFIDNLVEDGIFEKKDNQILCSLYPSLTMNMKACDSFDKIPPSTSFAIALVDQEEQLISFSYGTPLYCLLVSDETSFLKVENNQIWFRVDADDISTLVMEILEEEIICPQIRHLIRTISDLHRKDLSQKDMELLCLSDQVTPICIADLPKKMIYPRSFEIAVMVLPLDCEELPYIRSSDTSVIEVQENKLIPKDEGDCRIGVYLSNDPYPFVESTVRVLHRKLIQGFSTSPSELVLPVGKDGSFEVSPIPKDADNMDEIQYLSTQPDMISVNEKTGVIHAFFPGKWTVILSTPDCCQELIVLAKSPMEDIHLEKSHLELKTDDIVDWQFEAVPADSYGASEIEIISTNPRVAEYRNGKILAHKAGNCHITVQSHINGIQRTLQVSVTRRGLFG